MSHNIYHMSEMEDTTYVVVIDWLVDWLMWCEDMYKTRETSSEIELINIKDLHRNPNRMIMFDLGVADWCIV